MEGSKERNDETVVKRSFKDEVGFEQVIEEGEIAMGSGITKYAYEEERDDSGVDVVT